MSKKTRYTLIGVYGYDKLRVSLDTDPILGTILLINGRKHISIGRECNEKCNCFLVHPYYGEKEVGERDF
jgi:hypothetical protein